MSALVDDPEARLEYLLDRGVLVERGDAGIVTSEDFHAGLAVYEDSYLDASDEVFAESVASVFALDRADAAERIEATGMTRRELAIFLALRSHLDDPELTRDELALMTSMVADVGPASPVPEELTELTDETFDPFLAEHDAVVVFVFQRHCDPCDTMKADLAAIREGAPGHVVSAGVDGDEALAFRRAFRVGVAPTTLVFERGEPADRFEGREPAERIVEAIQAVHGSE